MFDPDQFHDPDDEGVDQARAAGADGIRPMASSPIRNQTWPPVGELGPEPNLDAMPAPRRAQVLAEELAGAGIEQPHVSCVPLDVDATADPARRRPVVGRRNLDAAVQMHGAVAVLVVAERLERQRAEGRPLLGEHGGDLPLGRAVDAGVGPALFPAVQIRLAVVEALEAESAQRRLLGVADGGFDLALAIGVWTRHGRATTP